MFTTPEDLEAAARERLSVMAYDYYAGGADDEVTLRENRAAFDRIRLRYRVLRGVGPRDTRTTLLGHALAMPLVVAPTAFHRMAHPDGELATVRAAGEAGTLMILSTLSTSSIEEVMAVASGPVFFQLYMYADRDVTVELVRRAEAAGCSALVVTVDAPAWGRRPRDTRNNFTLPAGLQVKNLAAARADRFPPGVGSGLSAYVHAMFKLDLGWDDIAWLCSITSLPVLIKGVVHPDDAALAVEHGVAGIVVSNHGGRQLDGAPATIEALPAIADAVDGRLPIMLDGGVRRGVDVVRALALGATVVAVGRPILWGLTVAGEAGVARVLATLRAELDTTMALCGAASIAEIGQLDLLMT